MSERTGERLEGPAPTRGRRARALLLCLVTLSLTTGADGCDAFIALIRALNEAAYGRFETPEPRPPQDVPGLTESTPFPRLSSTPRFGSTVALSDQLIVAGGAANGSGGARLTRRPDALLGDSLDRPPELPSSGLEFGRSVAALGARAFVGAPTAPFGDDSIPAGAVFVYEQLDSNSRPALVDRIDAPVPNFDDRFGSNLAADGNTLLVGAENFGPAGAIHVYERAGNTWAQRQFLEPPANAVDFGHAIAISGSRVAVGDPQAMGRGAVYMYANGPGGWTLDQTISSPDAVSLTEFGDAVALDGTRLVVGAPGADEFRGAAHVFTRVEGTWLPEQRLADDPERAREGQLFGSAVGVAGTRIVVGVPRLGFKGGVRIFDRSASEWSRTQTLSPASLENSDQFGAAIAIHASGRILVGAPERGTGRGVAYHYEPTASKRPLVAGKKPKVVPDTYMGFRPPPGTTLTDEIELPRTLWAPYRAQIGAGVFDPEQTEGLSGAGFCIGVQTQDTPRTAFEVAATFTAAGLDLQARTEAGPVGVLLSLLDTQRVDVSIERGASDVILSVRPLGSASFQELARITTGPQMRGFVPFIRSERVPSGAEIGYDDPVLESSGTGPGQPLEATLRDQVYDALTATIGARGPLEFQTPDAAAAGASIDQAATRLQNALTTAESILETAAGKRKAKKGPKPARKQLKKALKRVQVARKKLDKGKSAKSVLKQLEKARKFETKALAALAE